MVAVVASLLFLVLHLQAKPYKRPMDNMLATTINLSLVVFFFWCSLLQTGSLGDKGDIESGRLSNVGVGVSILMLISIVGVLLVASLLFVLEVAAKTATEVSERRKREKWAGHTTDTALMARRQELRGLPLALQDGGSVRRAPAARHARQDAALPNLPRLGQADGPACADHRRRR